MLKETKAANASQQAAIALQDKLKQTLISKLPREVMGVGNYTNAAKAIGRFIADSDYKGARNYVAKQLYMIGPPVNIIAAEKAKQAAAAALQKSIADKKDQKFKNLPKLDADRGPYTPSIQ
jgi:hypothetical protein